jgi:hypothetical protein
MTRPTDDELLEKARRGEKLTAEEMESIEDVEIFKQCLAEMLRRAPSDLDS